MNFYYFKMFLLSRGCSRDFRDSRQVARARLTAIIERRPDVSGRQLGGNQRPWGRSIRLAERRGYTHAYTHHLLPAINLLSAINPRRVRVREPATRVRAISSIVSRGESDRVGPVDRGGIEMDRDGSLCRHVVIARVGTPMEHGR